ncbi:hypothetical protein BH09SUM1_BH09SUM1_07200 [soil metagenome]
MLPNHIEVEVFRSGDYGPKGVYTPDDLATIARDYDPADHEAPVTLDHAQHGPAHGWVTRLRSLGDRLLATLTNLSPSLSDALRSQRFKKRSVELYRQHPRTGRPYLKAISFLGAAPPEVKGLADPAFSESVIAFEEDAPPAIPPAPTAAQSARARLMAAGAWLPAWEDAGLPAVFDALAGREELDSLLRFLERDRATALFSRLAGDGAPASFLLDETPPGAEPQSLNRHRQALELQRQHATLSYREALLRVR